MSDELKGLRKMVANLFGNPVQAPASKLTPELESAFWKAKAEQLEQELQASREAHAKLKTHCDQISNRILDLERDHQEIVLKEFDLKLQKLVPKDKIVCITTKHKSLLDHKMFARINHVLRHRCPWLDLVFMIHEDVDLKTMSEADLKTLGLMKISGGDGENPGGVLC